MFYRLLGILFVTVTINSAVNAQDSLFTIHQIKIEGNDVTKDFVILKQIPIERGEKLTRSKLQYYINRIYSLRYFTKVDYRLEPQGLLGYDLVIIVTERWFWAAFPQFRLKDTPIGEVLKNPAKSKVMYGFSVVHNNMLGRGINARFSALFGYDTEISLGFNNPYLFIDDNLSFGLTFRYSEAHAESPYLIEQSNEFIRLSRYLSNSYGYTISPYESVLLTYFLQSNSNNSAATLYPESVMNPTGTADENLGFTFTFKSDTRDLIEYAREGHFMNLSLTTVQELNTNQNYRISRIDLRYYYPVQDLFSLTAGMLHQKYYGRLIPHYDHNFYRRDEYGLRGYENLTLENMDMFISKFEIRKELIKIRTDEIEWIDWKQFRYFRWGLFTYVFSDFAFTNQPPQNYLGLNNFIAYSNQTQYYDTWLASAGAGLHVALPYSNFLRFELSVNKFNTASFWINSGRSF